LLGQPERCDTVCAYVRLVLTSAHCAGPAVYDKCDVCNGNGRSCLDCAGKANGRGHCARVQRADVLLAVGPAVYDVCDVCNGNGSRCLDCNGVPNGTSYCKCAWRVV
jgi:hypothetical protein